MEQSTHSKINEEYDYLNIAFSYFQNKFCVTELYSKQTIPVQKGSCVSL